MHCASLDTLVVKGATALHQSPPQQAPLLAKNTMLETKEEEDERILRMILDAGILVLEGRLPERASKRGYVEGPHCVLYPHTKQTHRCDFNSYLCKRAEKYRQLLQSIWNECKRVCIELRVRADCSCGEEQVWNNTSSRYDYVLEQWYFEITNFRNDDDDIGLMNEYGLLQAIRSQIHFSQLSAWWCNNRAQLPKNITYHVLPLSQADPNVCQLQHKFPVLSFGSSYLQVKIKSQPRSEVLPKIHCPVHCDQDVLDDRMRICCDRFGKHHCQAVEDLDENDNDRWFDNKNDFCCDGLLDTKMTVLSSSSSTSSSSSSSSSALCKEKTNAVASRTLLKSRCVGNASNMAATNVLKIKINNGRCLGNTSIGTFRRPSLCGNDSTSNVHRNNGGVVKCVVDKNTQLSSTIGDDTTTTTAKIPIVYSTPNSSPKEANNSQPFGISARANLPFANPMLWQMLNDRHRPPPPSYKNNSIGGDDLVNGECAFAQRESNVDRTDLRKRRGGGGGERRDANTSSKFDRDMFDCRTTYTMFGRIASTHGGGNRKCAIEATSKDISKSFGFDEKSNRVDAEEKKLPKLLSKSASMNALEKQFERLKHFREKRIRFEKSKKRLLPFTGNVIETVLSGRVYFTKTIENFKIKITCGGASSPSTQNNCTELPAATYYYHFGDGELSKSYLVKGFIPENEKGIQIPPTGRLQVSIFNTEDTLVKVFAISYDLTDMPRCSKTYLQHSNYTTPSNALNFNVKWLQSFLRLKCSCSKSGRLYLQNEINVIIFQKSDLNTACELKMKTDLTQHDITEVEYRMQKMIT